MVTKTQPAEPDITPGDVVTQAPKTTRITTVSVRVKRELDTGYLPFLRYMHKNHYKQPPFGMRDASKASFDIFISAEIGDGENVDTVCQELAQQAYAIADRELRAEYPEAFPATSKPEEPQVPEDAYVIAATTIERQAVGDF